MLIKLSGGKIFDDFGDAAVLLFSQAVATQVPKPDSS